MNAPATTPVQAIRRPTPTDFVPLQDLNISQLLEDPRVFRAIAESAPKHLTPQRLLRVMAQALRKTPKLGQCAPLSLLGAMITCSFLGLEPNTPLQHCFLIPFEKRAKKGTQWVTESVEINLILGYQGLLDLSRRTGSLVSVHADVVYEGDEFDFEYGSNMFLRHKPIGDREGRRPTYAYAHSKLEDGQAFEVLPYANVLRIRDNAQAFKQAMVGKERGDRNWATTPWISYEHEMASKTMFRRLSKWLPKSIEFASAVALDDGAERGMIDFSAIARQPTLAQDPETVTIEGDTQEPMMSAPQEEAQADPPKPPQQQKTAKTTNATAAKAKPPAAPATPPPPTEEDEREADRLQRAAQEGPPAVPQEEGEPEPETETTEQPQQQSATWSDYLNKMQIEFFGAKSKAAEAAITGTFKDAVLGAVERNQITEAVANDLLKIWAERSGKKK